MKSACTRSLCLHKIMYAIGWFLSELTGQPLLFEDAYIFWCARSSAKLFFHVLPNWAFAVKVKDEGFLTGLSLNPLENVSKSVLYIKPSDLLSAGKQQKSSLVCLFCHTSSWSQPSCNYCSVSLSEHSSKVGIITSFLPHLRSLHQRRHRQTTSNSNRMGWIHLIHLAPVFGKCE